MQIDLSGKTAVVTGAGRGLGKEIALRLAESGADVWIVDINESIAKASAADIAKTGVKSSSYVVDVSNEHQMRDMFNAIEKESEKIDIVVNCAGVVSLSTFADYREEEVKRLIDINILGTALGIKFGLEKMKPRKCGKIVNISSIAGRRGRVFQPFYAMSKAAVISMTQAAATDGALDGVNVNAICPGIIRTPMWDKMLAEMEAERGIDKEEIWKAHIKNKIPMNKPQEESDIAYAIVFLCSDFARYITGQALNIDGGVEMN